MESDFSRAVKILLCVIAFAMMCGCAAAPQGERSTEGILRLHVIANSDAPADQAVKLRVRDALLSRIEPGESADEARAYLLDNGAALYETVTETLRENGFSYAAQLELGRFDFPDRTYGQKMYPAGEYEALRVVLGRGAGQNWWCVLFPPLCIVTGDGEALEEGEKVTFESTILEWIRSWRVGE